MDEMEAYRNRQESAAAAESNAFSAGRDGFGFSPGSFQEVQAYERGQASRGGGGGAPVHPIALPFLAIMAIGFWPLCGALTLGAGFGTLALLGLVLPRLGDGWSALLALAVGIGGLVSGWKIEQRLAVSRRYRMVRHVVRLLWLALFFFYFALVASAGGAYSPWPQEITWQWIDSKLSPGMYVAIFIGVVLTHFVSRAFDDRIEGRVDPESLEKRKVTRAVRWRRMKRVFLGAGCVGAAGAALYGDKVGGIVGAFIAFGVVATILYWAGSHAAGLLQR